MHRSHSSLEAAVAIRWAAIRRHFNGGHRTRPSQRDPESSRRSVTRARRAPQRTPNGSQPEKPSVRHAPLSQSEAARVWLPLGLLVQANRVGSRPALVCTRTSPQLGLAMLEGHPGAPHLARTLRQSYRRRPGH